MTVLNIQPYSIAEDRGFTALTGEAVLNCILLSRTLLVQVTIPCIHHDKRRKVQQELTYAFETGLSACTFMCDMCTSNMSHSYISLICRSMTTGCKLKWYTLATRHMPQSHNYTKPVHAAAIELWRNYLCHHRHWLEHDGCSETAAWVGTCMFCTYPATCQ